MRCYTPHTPSRSSSGDFQPNSSWFRPPAAHRPNNPTQSSLNQARHFWVCANTCTCTSGEMPGRLASPFARAQPPKRTDTSLRHWRKQAVAWTTTNACSLASRWRSCDSCCPHKTRTPSLYSSALCCNGGLRPCSKAWHQQHKCKIKARAGCAPWIHLADVSAAPVGVSYRGRATENTTSAEGIGNVMYGVNRNWRVSAGPAWSLWCGRRHRAVCFSTVFLSLSLEGNARRLLMQIVQG